MPAPTFNSVTLIDEAWQMRDVGPRSRHYMGELPGVNGEFLHDAGEGAARYMVTGFIKSSVQTTAVLAHSALRAVLAAKHDLLAAGVAAFVDTAGISHTYCKLAQYVQAGDVEIMGAGSAFYGRMAVQAAIIDLDPSQTGA